VTVRIRCVDRCLLQPNNVEMIQYGRLVIDGELKVKYDGTSKQSNRYRSVYSDVTFGDNSLWNRSIVFLLCHTRVRGVCRTFDWTGQPGAQSKATDSKRQTLLTPAFYTVVSLCAKAVNCYGIRKQHMTALKFQPNKLNNARNTREYNNNAS